MYLKLLTLAGGGILKSVATKAIILGVLALTAKVAVGSYLDTRDQLVATSYELALSRDAAAHQKSLADEADKDRQRIAASSEAARASLAAAEKRLAQQEGIASTTTQEACPAHCVSSYEIEL